MVFDTTSLHFHSGGGTALGPHCKSKDFRPQCKQVIVGIVLDGDCQPVCSEIWPGNTAEPLQRRGRLRSICVVANRGKIRRETIALIEEGGWIFILGAPHRNSKEIRETFLFDFVPFETVETRRARNTSLELEIKEVSESVEATDGEDAGEDAAMPSTRHYVVCRSPALMRKDAATRAAIFPSLHKKLKQDGPKGRVGYRDFNRFLRAKGGVFEVDRDKIQSEARFDGIWVLQTNTASAQASLRPDSRHY